MGWKCGTSGKNENAYRLLVEKSEVKRPLRRPRLKWVSNIKQDLGELGRRGMD
jgi:hypothetical protein